jgi:hypothetical protein
LGKLKTDDLYHEMSTSEYWLYPTNFTETSCITALEMLMSEVICIYYPVAGLTNTMDKYGIQVQPGTELETIVSLTNEQKNILRKEGRAYAESCSWANRAIQWQNLLSIESNNCISTDLEQAKEKKNIAIFNAFTFHYEMFGYIIQYCKKYNYILTIFTPNNNSLGWLEFYTSHFNNYQFCYKDISEYSILKDTFDIVFITTDDDLGFKTEWINHKCISIEHTNVIRRPEYIYKIATRPFINNYREWVIPCFNNFAETDKTNMLDTITMNIAIIGGNNYYNYDTINRLYSNLHINLYIIARQAFYFDINKIINKDKIKVIILTNIETNELFEVLKQCDYIFCDCTNNLDHINGVSMSGSIPIAFSTLTPLIISKQSNTFYKFQNVIEVELDSLDNINIHKGVIDIKSMVKEREMLVSMFDKYLLSHNFVNKNTALIVEPRDIPNITSLIHDFKQKLGDSWHIVFYCGKGLKNKMTDTLDSSIEVRELNVNNFTPNEYSDFMKSKTLWNMLYGTYVLTFQCDTYILNKSPYTIDYFINMNKTYIGGNMNYNWNELTRENIFIPNRNFNGGLSLRNRIDMIKIIDTFGTNKTEYNSTKHQTDAEDVYFTIGCYKLNLPIGDDEACKHFSIHTIYNDSFFGTHRPNGDILKQSELLNNLYCSKTNMFNLTC